MNPIYLDYNATTPIDPAVVEAMLPYLQKHFGNPSSSHSIGVEAKKAVDISRQQVAELIGAKPKEIVFTSGGSEASNHAIKGVVFANLRDSFGRLAEGAHIITSTIEHPATLQPCEFLKRIGAAITYVPVDGRGIVDPDSVKNALIKAKTTLVSIMHSNNEVGSIQPIREIADLAHEYGALMHTDVAQSMGKIPVNVNGLGVDLLSIAGHKLYAPKGVGALYIRDGVNLEPLIHGAGHESGRRAGTENVPYMVALGKACALARESLPKATEDLRDLKWHLWINLRKVLRNKIVRNGPVEMAICLPNTLNISFLGHVGPELLRKIPEVAASTGSACHEGNVSISPVLKAIQVPPEQAQGAIRLTVGRFTTHEEIDRAVGLFLKALGTE